MTPIQIFLTFVYLGGIVLLLRVGYRLLVRFARPEEAAAPAPTDVPNEAGSRSVEASPRDSPAHLAQARRDMAYGALWGIFGTIATVVTYLAPGRTSIAGLGLVVYGATQFFNGLSAAARAQDTSESATPSGHRTRLGIICGRIVLGFIVLYAFLFIMSLLFGEAWRQ